MAKFQGSYVTEFEKALIASAVSGEHLCAIGAPGFGKTDVAQAMRRAIWPDNSVFLRIDASTPSEKVTGGYDPIEAINGRLVHVVKGTVYDPVTLGGAIVLDEAFRASSPVFDVFIDVLNRQDIAKSLHPAVWITSNFPPTGERTKAVIDRIGLWVWFDDAIEVDHGAIVEASLDSLDDDLELPLTPPTAAEIAAVRAMKPGKNATRAVRDYVENLIVEIAASETPFFVNPRRDKQWARLLFRTSALYAGSDDFGSIHAEALSMMKFCFPLTSIQLAKDWAELTQAQGDPVASEINQALRETYEQFILVKNSVADEFRLTIELGEKQAMFVRKMRDLADRDPAIANDPRVKEAERALTAAYAAIVRHEDPVQKYLD
jgi:MoxR-like ATPase